MYDAHQVSLKNPLGISAHVALAVPFALLAACGSSSPGSGVSVTGGGSGNGFEGAAGASGGRADSAGTAGIGGQSCAAWIACCNSLGDTGCVSAAQALEAQVAAGTISEATLETTCQGNLQILVTGHECAGTGGSGDGGVPPNSTGGAGGGGSGAGGSAGRGTAGTTGSAGAGGHGGAGGASQTGWTCEELDGTCTCYTDPIFSATSCTAGTYTCCYTLPPEQGISTCTCPNGVTAAICAMITGGNMNAVAHCPP